MQQDKLDSLLECYCQQGCREVTKVISQLENSQTPEELQTLSSDERDYIQSELKSIMSVYENGFCSA